MERQVYGTEGPINRTWGLLLSISEILSGSKLYGEEIN